MKFDSIYEDLIKGKEKLELSQGIYLVKMGDETRKIVVE